MEDALGDVIERIKAIEDPAERAREVGAVLNALRGSSAQLRILRQEAVVELRRQGWTYARIGEELGLHRNRVQQIAEGRTGRSDARPIDE